MIILTPQTLMKIYTHRFSRINNRNIDEYRLQQLMELPLSLSLHVFFSPPPLPPPVLVPLRLKTNRKVEEHRLYNHNLNVQCEVIGLRYSQNDVRQIYSEPHCNSFHFFLLFLLVKPLFLSLSQDCEDRLRLLVVVVVIEMFEVISHFADYARAHARAHTHTHTHTHT